MKEDSPTPEEIAEHQKRMQYYLNLPKATSIEEAREYEEQGIPYAAPINLFFSSKDIVGPIAMSEIEEKFIKPKLARDNSNSTY